METNTVNTPLVGSTIWDCDDTANIRTVIADRWDAYIAPDGWFLVESYNGYVTYGRLTGRTRRFWNIACPTIERYIVNTVADSDGVIRGVVGTRIPGTFAIRPERIAR